ncbi:MAG TPA: hypothetical protein PKD55_18010, partial [Bellilinea sp.]|nr:hypothetical protein [Bellilinea sp.]
GQQAKAGDHAQRLGGRADGRAGAKNCKPQDDPTQAETKDLYAKLLRSTDRNALVNKRAQASSALPLQDLRRPR